MKRVVPELPRAPLPLRGKMLAGSKITGNVRDELRRFPVRWNPLLNLTSRRLPQVNGKHWINNGINLAFTRHEYFDLLALQRVA